jgi:Tfp pilus assembly protein PilE
MKGQKRGFASAEMLIVLLIAIGVLAAVGLQKYAALRESADVTVMVDNLRNLAASQEAYFADHASYYGGEVPSPALPFVPTPGVTMTIEAAGAMGWSATAAATGAKRHCSVFYGDGGPVLSAGVEKQTACAAGSQRSQTLDGAQHSDTARPRDAQ